MQTNEAAARPIHSVTETRQPEQAQPKRPNIIKMSHDLGAAILDHKQSSAEAIAKYNDMIDITEATIQSVKADIARTEADIRKLQRHLSSLGHSLEANETHLDRLENLRHHEVQALQL